jgi:hypothetical protein
MEYQITDLSGKQMINGILLNGKFIDISTLHAGVYFVRFQGQTQKLIVY